jgi:hypothetical protein
VLKFIKTNYGKVVDGVEYNMSYVECLDTREYLLVGLPIGFVKEDWEDAI